MFSLEVEGTEVLSAKIAKMQAPLSELPITVPQEMEAWQRDDMHRKYPNTDTSTGSNEVTTSTSIWPRSRQPSKDQHHKHQGPKQYRPVKRGPVVRSNRPILRSELLTRLWERMRALASEAMTWP
ncbi:hypothetical protein [Bradyrhizobium cytisi]|uniref:Uncharacterized protein n=1 Tax=Bradyrhizobium cytisi TaxID=515489 RepID=A0A5S4X0L3_9BRAD|nr:hypothetical protein [Bradyrhizobium cytisi]TYL87432.1 hypothetical protein FXB38_04760 [Bradyrhizobium cytisi]